MAIDPKFVEYLLATKAMGMPAPNRFSGTIQRFMNGGRVNPDDGPGGPFGAPTGSLGGSQPNGMVLSATPGANPYAGAGTGGSSVNIEGSQAFSNMPFQSGFQAQVPTSNLAFDPGQYRGTINGAQSSLGRLSGMLMDQANGGGPNLAAQQERQATDRNIAQQFALAQANPNNPSAMKSMADNIGAMNQQAAADSATQRMQQQLAAQQQLQQLGLGQLGTAGSLATDQQRLALSQSQGNQNAALTAQGQNLQQTLANQALAGGQLTAGAQFAINAAQAGGQAMAAASQGGGGGGGGGSSGDFSETTDNTYTSGAGTGTDYTPLPLPDSAYARGGVVHPLARMYAAGGTVDPNEAGSLQAYDYAAPSQVADARIAGGVQAPSTGPASAASMLTGQKPGQGGNPPAWLTTSVGAVPIAGAPMLALYQGLKGTGFNGWGGNPDDHKFLGIQFSGGGDVPGHAEVSGNSYRNDTVPALLSPGEVVLPRSVTQSAHPADAAAAFVRHLHGAQRFADGGDVQPTGAIGDVSPLTGLPISAPQSRAALAQAPAIQAPPGAVASSNPLTGTPLAQSGAGMGDVKGVDRAAGLDTPAPAPKPEQPQAPNPFIQQLLGSLQQPQPKGDGVGTPGVGDYLQGVKQQQAAIQAQADVAAKKADVEAQAAQQKANLLTQVQADDKARQNAYDAEFNRQTQALQDAMTQFSKINTVVDPSRYWDSRSTGQKVLASIGVFLGGLGGGHNEAAASIQDAINRDVEAQKATISANMEKGRQGILNRTSLISIGREKFANDLQAEAFAKATMLDAAAAQAEAQAARLGNPAARAQAQMLAAQLQQEKGKQLQVFSNQAQELALRKSVQNLEMAKTGVELMRSMGQGQKGAGPNNAALDVLNNLEAKFGQANTGGMSVAAHLPAGVAPKTSEYLAHREAAKALLAKTLSGTERAPSPEMISMVEGMLPSPTTSAAEAKHRFEAIRTVLSSMASGGAGMPNTSGLEGDLKQED